MAILRAIRIARNDCTQQTGHSCRHQNGISWIGADRGKIVGNLSESSFLSVRFRTDGPSGPTGNGLAAVYPRILARRQQASRKTIKYTLSNALAETPLLRLAQMQGQRYWVERAFEDAKGECGLADYQALGWRAWHHHATMVMLAMLFIAEQRAAHQPGLELLSPRDIVEMLKESLPRKPEGKEALVARINQRHQRRRSAIASRFRAQQNAAPT